MAHRQLGGVPGPGLGDQRGRAAAAAGRHRQNRRGQDQPHPPTGVAGPRPTLLPRPASTACTWTSCQAIHSVNIAVAKTSLTLSQVWPGPPPPPHPPTLLPRPAPYIVRMRILPGSRFIQNRHVANSMRQHLLSSHCRGDGWAAKPWMVALPQHPLHRACRPRERPPR